MGSAISETDAAAGPSKVTVTVLLTATAAESASETRISSPPASRTASSERSVAVPLISLSKVMAKSLSNVW